MEHLHGIPATELSDSELERQGTRAHATRNWIYLHGTAEQFQRHTARMLELEAEYLRRHPKRTWQGSGSDLDSVPLDRVAQLRQVLRSFAGQMEELLSELHAAQEAAEQARHDTGSSPTDTQARLLSAFAGAPQRRLHKLEAHQTARALALRPERVADLYRRDPPLLSAAGAYRYLTEAGHQWLTNHNTTTDTGQST